MWKQIAEGEGVTSLKNLPAHEGEIVEGARCKLMLNLKASLPQGSVDGLEDILKTEGITGVSVISSGSTVTVYYRKNFPWLAAVVAIVLGSIALAILIISWKFFQDVSSTVPAPIVSLGATTIALLIGAIAILIVFTVWKTRGLSFGGVK